MPESYNALRRYLDSDFPELFALVGYNMAFNGPVFVQQMDATLDTVTQFDTENVDGMCAFFLDKLRALKGLKPLNSESIYKRNYKMELEVRLARAANEVAPWKQ